MSVRCLKKSVMRCCCLASRRKASYKMPVRGPGHDATVLEKIGRSPSVMLPLTVWMFSPVSPSSLEPVMFKPVSPLVPTSVKSRPV
jgi:hypothetical protein